MKRKFIVACLCFKPSLTDNRIWRYIVWVDKCNCNYATNVKPSMCCACFHYCIEVVRMHFSIAQRISTYSELFCARAWCSSCQCQTDLPWRTCLVFQLSVSDRPAMTDVASWRGRHNSLNVNLPRRMWCLQRRVILKPFMLGKMFIASCLFYASMELEAHMEVNTRPGRGGWMSPPLRFFCDAPRSMRRIVLKFGIAYGASFAQLLIKNWPGHVRSQRYDVTRGTRSGHFFCEK